jgi:hypothetical protein
MHVGILRAVVPDFDARHGENAGTVIRSGEDGERLTAPSASLPLETASLRPLD